MRTDKQTLESGLKKLKDVAAKNRILPIYSGILVQDGYMIASNSAYSVKLPIDSGLDHDAGFILMPDAINLISNLPAGDVEITKEGAGTIRVKGGKVKANFQSHDVSEFALMPKISDSIAFTVKWKEVKEKMASVLFACVRDDSKPLLRGLHLFTRDGVLNMLACDGYRLAWEQSDCAITFDGAAAEIDCVIDRDALWKLIELCDGEDLEIEMGKNNIAFRTDNFEMQARLIDGNYPVSEKLVPEYSNAAIVDMPELVSMMRRVRPLCKTVVIDAQSDTLAISCRTEGLDYLENIELQTDLATPLKIAFSTNLCSEMFNAFKNHDDVQIGFDVGEHAAVKPMTVKAGTLRAMLLPVRLNSQREANRAAELQLLQRAGEGGIATVLEQVSFALPGGVKYRADFLILRRDGTFIIEDAKGVRTKEYVIKKKLMAELGLEIREV